MTSFNSSLSNITSNISTEDLLESVLGSRYRSPAESGILTIAYGLIFITGLIGNISTCIVITRNNYMLTATNYYLFSLAISDVMTLILGLPPELYTIWEAYPWRLGEPYCLFKTFLTEMTSSASILTIAAFTTERYVAICYPIKAQTMSNLSRAVKIIIGIWFTAAISALPYPIHTRTYHYVVDPVTKNPIAESLICNIRPEWRSRMSFVFQLSTFTLFIIPMFLITILYIRIGLTLRRSGMTYQTSAGHGSPPHSQSRRAVLKMLVAVVVAFFICWAPFHSQRLMTVYISESEWTPMLLEIQSLLFYISGVLFFISATVNPILYNLMSKKYRQAFRDTLCWCFWPSASGGRRVRGQKRSAYERSATYVTYTQGVTSRYTSKRLSQAQNYPLMCSPRQNPHRQLSENTSGEELSGQRTQNSIRSDVMWRDLQARRLSCHTGRSPDVNGRVRGNVDLDMSESVPLNEAADPICDVTIPGLNQNSFSDDIGPCQEELELADINMVRL